MVATAPATRTRYVNMEPQLEIPAIQGTGLLGASSPLRDDMLTQIAAARASASARSVLPTSNRLASVRLRPEIQERIETRDPAAGLGGGDVKLSCVSVRTLQQLAAVWRSNLQRDFNVLVCDRFDFLLCFENSTRAIDSSKNQPNRLRCDRAREF